MTIEHFMITPEIVREIRTHSIAIENAGRLTDGALEMIYRERWLQVMVPEAAGGLEWELPRIVRLFESLAYADANLGWCVNLGAGANMFAGYLDPGYAARTFSDPRTCCAGSGAISGDARRTEGGYLLSGRWKYASGAAHATHFTANARLLNDQGIPLQDNGTALFRSFIVPAGKIINHNNWHAIGLKGTSSNDFEAQHVFVPDEQVFSLVKPSPFAQGPLYAFPFAQLAVVNMSSMATGIALHFSALYTELAAAKTPLHSDKKLQDHPIATHTYEELSRRLATARTSMYDKLDAAWRSYEAGGSADEQALSLLSTAARHAAAAARDMLNGLYPLCGMSILDPASELNKVWRDGMTALQHYLLSPLYT